MSARWRTREESDSSLSSDGMDIDSDVSENQQSVASVASTARPSAAVEATSTSTSTSTTSRNPRTSAQSTPARRLGRTRSQTVELATARPSALSDRAERPQSIRREVRFLPMPAPTGSAASRSTSRTFPDRTTPERFGNSPTPRPSANPILPRSVQADIPSSSDPPHVNPFYNPDNIHPPQFNFDFRPNVTVVHHPSPQPQPRVRPQSRGRNNVIDLTLSDDDEPEFVQARSGAPQVRVQAPTHRRAVHRGMHRGIGIGNGAIVRRDFQREMESEYLFLHLASSSRRGTGEVFSFPRYIRHLLQSLSESADHRADLDRALNRRGRETEALLAADAQDERRRAILSPPAARIAARNTRPRHDANIAPRGAVVQDGLPVPAAGRTRATPFAQRRPLLATRQGRRAALQQENIPLFDEDDDDDLDYEPGHTPPPDFFVRPPRPAPGGREGNRGMFHRLFDMARGWGNFGDRLDAADLIARANTSLAEAGPGRPRQDNVTTTLGQVQPFPRAPPLPGYTSSFDIEAGPEVPISIDDNGKVVEPKNKIKPYLACANCPQPLLVSNVYQSPDDRVWVLRCGHLIDQRCLTKVSTPQEDDPTVEKHPPGGLEILDAHVRPQRKRATKKRKVAPKTKEKAQEYEWVCPAEGCCGKNKSYKGLDKWEQKPGAGAMAVYM